jgi:hypothetical protein
MLNLATLGYPNEMPGGMSPGGKVVTKSGHWYQLGNPASVFPLPPVPAGFFSTSGGGVINDNGDQAHFLVTSGSQNLIYPFRLSNGGAWQQLSGIPTGRLSRAGLGSINLAQDVTFTAGSTGLIAAGPNGVGQPLAGLISPAYPGATVGGGGPMNNAGQILTSVMIGRSSRVMKMTPVTPCGSNCLVSGALVMNAVFVQDPAFPGSCFQGGKMYTTASVTATFTDEAGAALANVQVSGRFLDDYWTNTPVSGTTNASGVVTFNFRDLCGVGAIAFLIDKATLGTRTLDRTRGVLSTWQIPIIPPLNQPPVARWTVSCQPAPAHVCTLNGTGSSDPDGTIVSYKWTNTAGTTLSTLATFTRTFPSGGKRTWSLTVTDNGGATGKLTKTFTVP